MQRRKPKPDDLWSYLFAHITLYDFGRVRLPADSAKLLSGKLLKAPLVKDRDPDWLRKTPRPAIRYFDADEASSWERQLDDVFNVVTLGHEGLIQVRRGRVRHPKRDRCSRSRVVAREQQLVGSMRVCGRTRSDLENTWRSTSRACLRMAWVPLCAWLPTMLFRTLPGLPSDSRRIG